LDENENTEVENTVEETKDFYKEFWNDHREDIIVCAAIAGVVFSTVALNGIVTKLIINGTRIEIVLVPPPL
jgi:hypothetical protein